MPLLWYFVSAAIQNNWGLVYPLKKPCSQVLFSLPQLLSDAKLASQTLITPVGRMDNPNYYVAH